MKNSTKRMLNKEISKEDLRSVIHQGHGSFKETWIDYYYQEIKESIPVKENFIRINCVCCFPEMFYNFRMRTSMQLGFFHLCTALGDINDVWKFLEDISQGQTFSAYLSEQEGPVSLLIAKSIDEENIRLTLFNFNWYEEEFNHNSRKTELYFCQHKDNSPHVNFDVILNKKNFIYTFYICLRTIFDEDNPSHEGEKITHNVTSDEPAQRDSDIIKTYLGYLQPTKKDLELFEAVKSFDLIKIENCIKDGANPNALIADGEDNVPMLEAFLEFAGSEEKISIRKTFAVIKLLIKYGAKTWSIYYAIWGLGNLKIIQYLVNNNCVFDDYSIGDVSTDAYYMYDPFTPSSKWYQKLYHWYDTLSSNVSNSLI